MSSKSKSSLSVTPTSKASPATPRSGRISRVVSKSEANSPSPLQNSRLAVDQSPRSVTSKPTVDRRSPNVTPPTAKPAARAVKGSDLQAQLSLVQEDLKKAKEKISLIEKEKENALDELKEAQKLAEVANEKLRDALVAQKRAEESSEIEKFRAIEMEQAEIEASQKKEEEWKRELEAVRSQHALDVAALLSTTEELQKAQLDLAVACDAKNQALSHADDATKVAEVHAQKVEILSAELIRLKSKLEAESDESKETVLKLREEVDVLRQEVDKAKVFEERLSEKEAFVEKLNVELEAAKMAESYACSLVEDWKNRVHELEMRVAEANKLERSASESMESIMKQLEQKIDLLHDAESEVAFLKEKVGMLEKTIGSQNDDLKESESRLDLVIEARSELAKMVESLKAELEAAKEEKVSALEKEKLAVSSVQSLREEKEKLVNDLKTSKEDEERSKKSMESLTSAFHEVSAEARDAKEKLLCVQIEHEECEAQMENLRLVLKETKKKYETVLDKARREVDILAAANVQSKYEYENDKAEWEQKELHLVDCVKQLEEENSAVMREKGEMVNLLKQAEEEADAAKVEESRLRLNLAKVEEEVTSLQDSLGEAKAEAMNLKEGLLDKEEEIQRLVRENEEIRIREEASLKKIEEMSKLLEEAMTKNQQLEKREVSDSEKEYDMLPKVVEFSKENGHGGEEKHKIKIPQRDEYKNDSFSEEPNTEMDSVEIEKKVVLPEMEAEEAESFEDDLDSKIDVSESFDEVNGVNSSENAEDGVMQQVQKKKKKKPLLGKFGNLLKKKGASNTK